VDGLEPGDDGSEESFDRMSRDSEVWDMAAVYAVQSVIRPQDTRDHLIRMLEIHRSRMTGDVGRHLMATWPTSF
jgi:methylmalonyl-CoA decarboxylase subunit alpha